MKDGRSKLKQSQIDILNLIYKYRFTSRQLLLESMGSSDTSDSNNGLYRKLEIFIKHGLISKRLEKRQKLLGIPAAYYLAPGGVRALQDWPGFETIPTSAINAAYRNKTVDTKFVNRTIAIHKYTNLLHRHYPSLKVFTQRDVARFSYFPKPLPDVVLSLSLEGQDEPLRFFLDIIPSGTPRPAIEAKLKTYCEFFENGGWDKTNSPRPAILLATSSARSERQLQYLSRTRLSRYGEINLRIFTTTVQALNRMDDEGLVWTRVTDTDQPRELSTLLD